MTRKFMLVLLWGGLTLAALSTLLSCSKIQAPLEPLIPITPLPVATVTPQATTPTTPAATLTQPPVQPTGTSTLLTTPSPIIPVTGTTTPIIIPPATTSPTRQATSTPTSTRTATRTYTRTPVPTRTYTPTPTPLPTSFQNFEEGNGTPENIYYQDVNGSNPMFTSLVVFEGKRALQISPKDNNGTVMIFPCATSMKLTGANEFWVWVYDEQGDNPVYLTLWDEGGKSQTVLSVDTGSLKVWKQVHWKLGDFTDVDLSRIKAIYLRETYPGTYTFDDICFGN